jgi:hypothetical protein
MTTVLLAAVALVVGLAAGYILAAVRRPTTQDDHDRAVAEFVKTNRLRPGRPTADLSEVTIGFDQLELIHAGIDAAGVDVFVNARPFPARTGITIDGLPPHTTVVVIGGEP